MNLPRGFWAELPRPIVALSPMDGVTNAPFRQLVAEYGPADVSFTEFVPVEGLMHKAVRLLRDFMYTEAERPVVAQIYGCDVDGYYAIAHLLCALGFDGIDINMGCPAKKVEQRGCGAGLIRTPDVAQQLVRATQRGVRDWAAGQSPIEAGLPRKVWKHVEAMFADQLIANDAPRTPIPVSVKTRIGYDSNAVDEWMRALLEVEPVTISLHGRTLKQMYKGSADWDAIAQAAAIVRPTGTIMLGNGDLLTPEDIAARIGESQVDGVLVGRGCLGNPWLFRSARALRAGAAGEDLAASAQYAPSEARRVFEHHAQLQENFAAGKGFSQIRRFVKPYTLGWPDAVDLRLQLFQTKTVAELNDCLANYWAEHGSELC